MRHDRRVPEFVRRSAHAWHEPPKRARLTCLALLAVCPVLGCESEAPAKVHLNLGPRAEDQRSFVPRSSLAEYTEFASEGAELRVILSSHPIPCDAPIPLSSDQTLVALTFQLPNGMKLQPGPYLWTGVAEAEPNVGASSPTPTATAAPASSAAASAPNAVPPDPPLARVMPFIRLGKHGVELPPGGHVELTEIRLDPQGLVRGLLKIEQAGSVGLPATSLLGSFSARWCRISPLIPNEGR